MATQYTIGTEAWLKAMLHAAKHPSCAVCGVFLGNAGDAKVVVQDTCPMFHHPPTAPMIEAALEMIEEFAGRRTPALSIVGFYQANQRAKDTTLGVVPQRIAAKIADRCHGAAICLLNPSEIVDSPQQALQLYARSSNDSPFAPAHRNLKVRDVSTANGEALAACLGEGGAVENLVDMDDHFDDVARDWRNEGLVSVTEAASAGAGAAGAGADESKGAEGYTDAGPPE